MWVRGLLAFALFFACGHDKAAPDATQPPPTDSARPDAPATDAPPVIDAPTDALPEVSPACTTTPAILIDTVDDQMSNIANLDGVLYTVVYHLDTATDTVTNARVVTFDMMTGAPLGTPFALAGVGSVWQVGTSVYVGEGIDGGAIWRFQAGQPPSKIVSGRPTVYAITDDGTYVYWTEGDGVATDVKRQLIAGGPVTEVMSCAGHRLLVTDDLLYCADSTITYVAKDGSGAVMGITGSPGYPIYSVLRDGGDLYFTDLYNNPTIYRATLPSGPATVVKRETTIGRYVGFAMNSAFFYAIDSNRGIGRIDRSTHQEQLISHLFTAGFDPLLWNGWLYFGDQNPSVSGYRYVRRCVD